MNIQVNVYHNNSLNGTLLKCLCNLSLSLSLLIQSQGNDETQQLQKALLDYMEENAETDASLVVGLH